MSHYKRNGSHSVTYKCILLKLVVLTQTVKITIFDLMSDLPLIWAAPTECHLSEFRAVPSVSGASPPKFRPLTADDGRQAGCRHWRRDGPDHYAVAGYLRLHALTTRHFRFPRGRTGQSIRFGRRPIGPNCPPPPPATTKTLPRPWREDIMCV